MCRRLRERSGQQSWERSRMREAAAQERPAQERIVILSEAKDLLSASSRHTSFTMTILLLVTAGVVLPLLSCSQAPDPNTLVMIIESSPTNLDPRVGIDAQSERIGELLLTRS